MILLDTISLYNSCKQKHQGVIDYTALFHYIESTHGRQDKIAYIAEHENCERFIELFKGFTLCTIKLKKPKQVRDHQEVDFAVEIVLDCMSLEYSNLILCTTDVRFLPLFQFLDSLDDDEHVPVSVYGCGVPRVFDPYAGVFEIPEKIVRAKDVR